MVLSKRSKETLKAAASWPPLARTLRRVTHGRLPYGMRLKLFLRVASRVRPPDNPFVHTIDATAVRFSTGDTARRLYWLGTYEPETCALFVERARRARSVLDIGARDGIYALHAAAVNPLARIIAFEPDPAGRRLLEHNLEQNPSLRVEVSAIALSDHDGNAILYESGGTSSLNIDFRRGARPVDVEVARGDTVLDRLGVVDVDLVKIDTESTEPAVLRGLERTIRRDRPDIICEVLPGRAGQELQRLVDDFGYRAFRMTRSGLVESAIVGDRTYRFPNYLLVPAIARRHL